MTQTRTDATRIASKHPQGCSCGSPECPQHKCDLEGVAYEPSEWIEQYVDSQARKLTKITVYWDTQDPANEGWAYRVYYADGYQHSSRFHTVADDDIDNAIDEACFILGAVLTHDDFAVSYDGGGFADWIESDTA